LILQMKTRRINCWEVLLLIALLWDRNRAVKYLLYKPYRFLKLTALFHAQPVKLPVSRCMPG